MTVAAAKPYCHGGLSRARVMLVGHDPRLRRSDTVAPYCLFADHFFRPKPKGRAEARKHGLAESAFRMVTDVTGVIEHEFTLDDDADKGTYVVDIVLTYLDFEVTRMATFNVEWSGFLVVEFSKDYYYSGQTAAMDFKVVDLPAPLGPISPMNSPSWTSRETSHKTWRNP